MAIISNSYHIFIQAKPEAVYSYVSDLTRHPEWSGGRLRIEAGPAGPAKVGSTYQSYGDLPNQKERRNELRVTLVQPPSLFTFIAKDPDFGEVEHTFMFTSENDGTLVERTVSTILDPMKTFMFKIFIHPLIGKPMMDKAMKNLKQKFEK